MINAERGDGGGPAVSPPFRERKRSPSLQNNVLFAALHTGAHSIYVHNSKCRLRRCIYVCVSVRVRVCLVCTHMRVWASVYTVLRCRDVGNDSHATLDKGQPQRLSPLRKCWPWRLRATCEGLAPAALASPAHVRKGTVNFILLNSLYIKHR